MGVLCVHSGDVHLPPSSVVPFGSHSGYGRGWGVNQTGDKFLFSGDYDADPRVVTV